MDDHIVVATTYLEQWPSAIVLVLAADVVPELFDRSQLGKGWFANNVHKQLKDSSQTGVCDIAELTIICKS